MIYNYLQSDFNTAEYFRQNIERKLIKSTVGDKNNDSDWSDYQEKMEYWLMKVLMLDLSDILLC